jgi:hypothetical protein
MTFILFPNENAKDRALELLLGEYPLKSWKTGELLLPEDALPLLARKNVPFTHLGMSHHIQCSPLDKTP